MYFREYYKSLKSYEKKELAKRLDTSPCQLSQLATGHRKAGAKFLLTIEKATRGKVKPIELRPS